jgi:hypothetical protein
MLTKGSRCYRELIKSQKAKKAKSQFKNLPSQLAAAVSDLLVWVSGSSAFIGSILLCLLLINLSVYFVGG